MSARPTPALREPTVEHALPVQRRELVEADGAVRVTLRVFCPVERRSLEPRQCAHCEFCIAMPEDVRAPGAVVKCVLPSAHTESARPLFLGAQSAASSVAAGQIATGGFVCVRVDAPLRTAHASLETAPRAIAVVVDEAERPLGLLARADVTATMRGTVSRVMDAHPSVLLESAPLSEAIARMAYKHVRFVVLVDERGRAAGLLSELDVLGWVAHAGDP